MSVTPHQQIVDVADTVKFRCSASAGFPAATLRWRRANGRKLPQFSKFLSRTGVFKILAASRRDEGEYMCTATNSGGKSVMRVQLLVKGKELRSGGRWIWFLLVAKYSLCVPAHVHCTAPFLKITPMTLGSASRFRKLSHPLN